MLRAGSCCSDSSSILQTKSFHLKTVSPCFLPAPLCLCGAWRSSAPSLTLDCWDGEMLRACAQVEADAAAAAFTWASSSQTDTIRGLRVQRGGGFQNKSVQLVAYMHCTIVNITHNKWVSTSTVFRNRNLQVQFPMIQRLGEGEGELQPAVSYIVLFWNSWPDLCISLRPARHLVAPLLHRLLSCPSFAASVYLLFSINYMFSACPCDVSSAHRLSVGFLPVEKSGDALCGLASLMVVSFHLRPISVITGASSSDQDGPVKYSVGKPDGFYSD